MMLSLLRVYNGGKPTETLAILQSGWNTIDHRMISESTPLTPIATRSRQITAKQRQDLLDQKMKETIVLIVKARQTVMHVSYFSQIPTAKQTKQRDERETLTPRAARSPQITAKQRQDLLEQKMKETIVLIAKACQTVMHVSHFSQILSAK